MTNELRLTFARHGRGWRFTLHPNWSAQPSQPARFRSPLTEKDYEDLRWYLEEFMDFPGAGDHIRARDVEGRMEAWGRDLYEQLFGHGDRRELLNDLLDSDPPQVLSVASQESEVLRLPWELLRDHRGPFTRRGITIRRQFEGGRRRPDYPAGLPLRILLVVSRPDDLGFIDPRSTTRGMLDALDTLAGDVQVDFCRPPTLPRLEQMLAEASRRGQPYHILHFDGHGTYMPTIGLGALCFEKETATGDCPTDLVPANRMGDLLAAENIPLAILEACRSGAVARQPVFRSVAPRLVESGVGSVVAMSHAVHVEATRILVERFYRELAAGSTVGSALEAGRAALMADPYRWLAHDPQASIPLQDWFLPNLYQRVEDAALVPPRPLSPLPTLGEGRGGQGVRGEGDYPYDAFLSHSHANEEQVERFATTLRDRYGLRIFLDKWEIHRGPIHMVCEEGIRKSRCLLLACTEASLASDWVAYEEAVARAIDPRGRQIIPLRLDETELPPRLDALRWYDFRDPAQEGARLAELAAALGGELAVPGARRAPARGEDVGAFPLPPRYRFIGRARELHELERALARHRAVLVSGMGGMGKTALSREAAFWWARSGLFPDGACFLSFERGADAEAAVQTLGTYLLGDDFQRLPEDKQRAEAARLFQEKQVLMVWDNFESILPQFGMPQTLGVSEDPKGLQGRLRALFEEWTADEHGRGRLLITARPEEAGLPRARRFALGGLARPDSLLLTARVFELHDIPRDDPRLARDKLEELLDLMGDHPLSIELVMPHFKSKTLTVEQAMAQYADLLAAEQRQAEERAAREGRPVERNESLLASLAFSTSRLSEAAQKALPWLAWFTAGVFEQPFLDFSNLQLATWDSVRAELEATALISVDDTLEIADRPYLRFHPTLPYAADAAQVLDVDEAQRRFVDVYRAVRQAVHQAFFGENPRAGMEVMACEEGNMRLAVQRALELGEAAAAADLGDTMGRYLKRAGRLGERDRWAGWLAEQVAGAGWTEQAAATECDAAWALLSQGQPRPAIQRLEALIARLETTTEFDPTFQLAMARQQLGDTIARAGLAEQAIPVLQQAVGQWEALGQEQRGNLAACLGDLANALRNAGRLDKALEVSERSVSIREALGHTRDAAAAHGQAAQILALQGRHAEADDRYEWALQAARAAADQELEGTLLQH